MIEQEEYVTSIVHALNQNTPREEIFITLREVHDICGIPALSLYDAATKRVAMARPVTPPVASEPPPEPTQAAAESVEPTEKVRHQKLNLRLIKAPLGLNCRIVYSFLWKWAAMNHTPSKFRYRKVTGRRLRNATGFRPATITQCLAKLKRERYIDDRLEPYPQDSRLMTGGDGKCMFRRLSWPRDGKHDIRTNVIREFIQTDQTRARKSAAYWVKVLGISRSTYFRALATAKGVVTDDTGVVTDDTPKR